MLDFVAVCAESQPLVLLLDDLHWADPASLDLLRVLARAAVVLRLLVIATYRSDGLTRHHPLYPLLPVLVREAAAVRIDLLPLTEADLRALVVGRYALPDPDTHRLVTYLHARSEGNPFFVGELLRTLEVERVLQHSTAGWVLGALSRVRVPTFLRQVIDGRVMQLGEEAQRLLTVAAVIGHEVPEPLWAAVTGSDDDKLATVIEDAMEAHIIETSPRGREVRFVHALIREALYESIIPLRRSTWHRLVAEQMLSMPDVDPDAVAYHLRQAGDPRAGLWLFRAGERAERAYAWLSAIDRYEAALALLTDETPGAEERGWLLYRLARVLRYNDPWRGLAYLDEAAREAGRHHDALLGAVVLFNRGFMLCSVDDYRQGIPAMEAGLVARERLADIDMTRIQWEPGVRGAPRGTLAYFLAEVGRFDEARTIGERLTQRGIGAVGGDAYKALRTAYAALGRPDDARVAFQHSYTAYRGAGHYLQIWLTIADQIKYIAIPYEADNPGVRALLADEAEEVYRQASGASAHDSSRWARTPVYLLEGGWDEAERGAQEWLAGGRWQLEALPTVGWLAYHRGDHEHAWERVREGIPSLSTVVPGEASFLPSLELLRLAGVLAIEAGDMSAARDWLEAHDRWLAWSGAVLGRAEGALGWAAYYRVAGEVDTANQRASEALAHASEPRQPLALLAAHRLLGELATDARRYEDAVVHLRQSLLLADACAAPFERALTLLAFAELHAAIGERAHATTDLEEVRAICMPLGAQPTLSRADALAARLAATEESAPAYPAGLSAREVEVLQLLARGRTNREIADALFLSPNTVRIHVTHILEKTNTDNRAAAAAFAQRYGLA